MWCFYIAMGSSTCIFSTIEHHSLSSTLSMPKPAQMEPSQTSFSHLLLCTLHHWGPLEPSRHHVLFSQMYFQNYISVWVGGDPISW